jgi:hypothetical protein
MYSKVDEAFSFKFYEDEECELYNLRKKVNLPALAKRIKINSFRQRIIDPMSNVIYEILKYIEKYNTFENYKNTNSNVKINLSIIVSVKNSKTYLNLRALRLLSNRKGLHKVKYQHKVFHRNEKYISDFKLEKFGVEEIIAINNFIFYEFVENLKLNYIHNISEEQQQTWYIAEIISGRVDFCVDFEKQKTLKYTFFNDKNLFFLELNNITTEIEGNIITSIHPFSAASVIFENNLPGLWSFTEKGVIFEEQQSALMFKLLFEDINNTEELLKGKISEEIFDNLDVEGGYALSLTF